MSYIEIVCMETLIYCQLPLGAVPATIPGIMQSISSLMPTYANTWHIPQLDPA